MKRARALLSLGAFFFIPHCVVGSEIEEKKVYFQECQRQPASGRLKWVYPGNDGDEGRCHP